MISDDFRVAATRKQGGRCGLLYSNIGSEIADDFAVVLFASYFLADFKLRNGEEKKEPAMFTETRKHEPITNLPAFGIGSLVQAHSQHRAKITWDYIWQAGFKWRHSPSSTVAGPRAVVSSPLGRTPRGLAETQISETRRFASAMSVS